MNEIIKKIYDEKIEKLKGEIICTKRDIENKEDEISMLEDDIEELRSDIDEYNSEIKSLENIEPENVDEFTKNFICVSKFAASSNDRPNIFGVNVTENSLQACNGFMAIELTCDIPESLKGMRINSNARKNFEENIIDTNSEFLNYNEMFMEHKKVIVKKASEWIDFFLVESKLLEKPKGFPERYYKYAHICEIDGVKVGFNRYYIADLFSFIDDDENVSLHWGEESISPLQFHTDKIKALICPVRIKD